MAEKKLVCADDFTNPGGDQITKGEVQAAIGDITSAFKKFGDLHAKHTSAKGADSGTIQKSSTACKVIFVF